MHQSKLAFPMRTKGSLTNQICNISFVSMSTQKVSVRSQKAFEEFRDMILQQPINRKIVKVPSLELRQREVVNERTFEKDYLKEIIFGPHECLYHGKPGVYRGYYKNGKRDYWGQIFLSDGLYIESNFQSGLLGGNVLIVKQDGKFFQGSVNENKEIEDDMDQLRLEVSSDESIGPKAKKKKNKKGQKGQITEKKTSKAEKECQAPLQANIKGTIQSYNHYRLPKVPTNFQVFQEDDNQPKKVVKKNGEINNEEEAKSIDRKYGYIYYRNGELYRGMINKSKQHGIGELLSEDGQVIKRSKYGMREDQDVHVLNLNENDN